MNLYFDPSWKKIAISLSGGADSALLAYLICKKVSNQEIHFINHIRCWKTKPWQEVDAINVIQYIKKAFPQISFYIHKNFIAPDLEYGTMGPTITDEYGKKVSGDNAEIRGFAEYICFKKNIEVYYNAVTCNPKNVAFSGMKERDLDKNDSNAYLEKMSHMGKLAIHPFRFISKDKIYQKYIEHNILDLFHITRSCEGTFDNITFKNYTPETIVPVCNNCFWCKERQWAIEENI